MLWLYRLAMAVIVAGMMTLGSIYAYVLWPEQVAYIDTPVPVVCCSPIKGGDWLTLQLRYSKPYAHESLVGVMFASEGHVAFGPLGMSSLPVGDHSFKLHIQVPPALPAGRYVAILVIDRRVRLPLPAVFDRTVTASSEPFWVQ